MAFVGSSGSESQSHDWEVGNPNGAQDVSSNPSNGVSAQAFLASIAGYAATQVGSHLLDAGIDRAKQAGEGFIRDLGKGGKGRGRGKTALHAEPPGKGGNGGRGSGGGNGGKGMYTGGSSGFQGLYPGHFEGQNAPIEWSSPVNSGTITNPSQDTTEYYSPMYITCGQLFPLIGAGAPDFEGSFFNDILDGDIFYDYLRAAENNINRELSAQFVKEDFKDYIHKTLRALQIYYTVDSIIAYNSRSDNCNPAMEVVRSRMSPTLISNHMRLKEKLEREIMNPDVVKFIRFMYQNFALGEQKCSPVIRLSYGEMLCSNLEGDRDDLQTGNIQAIALNEMNSTQYSKTSSFMRRAFPEWQITLLPSTYEVVYSEQFINFWHNHLNSAIQLSSAITNPSELMFSHTVSSRSSEIYYGIEGEEVDGMIYAVTSVIDTSKTPSNYIHCGIWAPITVFSDADEVDKTSIKIYNGTRFTGIFTLSRRVQTMVFNCPYFDNKVVPENPQFSFVESGLGSKRILQIHTVNNMRQAISESVRYLFKPGHLPAVRVYRKN